MIKIFFESILLFQILFMFCYCHNDKTCIIINKHKLKNEIVTKNGLLILERDVETDFDCKFCGNEKNTFFHISKIKDLKKMNLLDLKRKYQKFNLNIFKYQSDILRIVSYKNDLEMKNILITEFLYEAKYINKKIYSIGSKDDYTYFGGIPNSFKYYKKYTLNINDIIYYIKIGEKIIDISNNKFNFFDFISGAEYIKLFYNYLDFELNSEKIFSNIEIKIGNNKLLIKKIDFGKESYCKLINNYLENFIYRIYDLENNEINLYLEYPKDIIIDDNETKNNYNKLSYECIFLCLLVISIILAINYEKNKNFEYPDNLYIYY